jgi:hypothetical protein
MSPAQMAYGLLWLSFAQCGLVFEARRKLLDALTSDERRAAIAWAKEHRIYQGGAGNVE